MTRSGVRRSSVLRAAARFSSFAAFFALAVSVMLIAASCTVLAQQSTTQFADGLNTPAGGLVLTGTAINPATGNPFRHLWTADPTNGLCRLDPDVDTVASHSINLATCLNAVNGATFNPGQITFDPASNTIYSVDGGQKLGIFVLHFLPSGDSGHGLLDTVNQSTLAPSCGIATSQPNATSLGPDGNLYVGFRRNGNIMRVLSPLANPLPCANVQPTVIVTGDKLTSQMAWIGHNLFLNDSRLPLIVDNGTNLADACFTPQNGNVVCSSLSTVSQLPTAQATMISDQTPGHPDGDNVYYGGSVLNVVTAETAVTLNALGGIGSQGIFTSPFGAPAGGINFTNISALAVDASNPTSEVLYVGDDPSGGATPGTGRWFQVLSAPPPPGPPSAPLNVTATGGNASATLTWAAPGNHQPVTSYTVHDSGASNGLPVADITVNGPAGSTNVPTSANITGLVNDVTYQFEVLATNNLGSSPFSALSNPVTPQAPTVPGAPANVSASPGNGLATVSWTAPASNGGSPITGYTVSTFSGGVLVGTTPSSGTGTSATVFPLTNGVAYTVSVHATNAVGNGPESALSAPVTPGTGPNVTITMTGPSSVVAGANAVYTLILTNTGSAAASTVTLSDAESGASVSTAVASQGACTIAGTNVSCNVGTIAPGNTVTITLTLKPSSQTTNSATVQFAGGTPGTASVTTEVIPLNQTTDLQLVGSAQNGGPTVTGTDVFTWQIKNAQSLAANLVVFTSQLPSTMAFLGASSGCTSATDPATGGTSVTCNLGTLSGGQTAVVTVTVGFTTTGTMATTGNVTFNGTDNNTTNNNASISVGVK